MAYDAVSNRTLLADSTGRYTTLYDALNRERAVTNPANLTISYAFDGAGRRSKMVEPFGGVFTYGYSATGLNTLVINPQGDRTTWQFDANSRVKVQLLANGVRDSYAYDNADRLLRLANLTSTGTTITSYVDTWDAANNRLHRVEQDGTRVTWAYDSTYQLINEQRSGAHSYNTTYSYDPAGNRRFKLDNAVRTTYSYDAANQLQKYVDNTGTTTFSFDASGNQHLQIASAGGGTTTNTWDSENRLTKVALPTNVMNTFTFNADGLCVQRQDSAGTSKQIWDAQKIVEETDQTNVSQVVYTQSAGIYGDVVSQRRSGVSRYFVFDPLGSTSCLTDGSQNVTDSYLFKAFGESLLAAGPTSNPFQFIGSLGYYSEISLGQYSARARNLVEAVGRWLSVDPLPTFNGKSHYLYVNNRPLISTDPSGALLNPIVARILLGLISAISTCAFGYFLYANEHYADRSDKFRHCWVSCRVGHTCGGLIAQYAGYGKEIRDQAIALFCAAFPDLDVCQHGHGDFWDSIADIAANNKCLYWEEYVFGPFGGLVGSLFRECCEDCCDRYFP